MKTARPLTCSSSAPQATAQFPPGGQVKGTYWLAGEPDGQTLWLTEGYATGLTVHRLTGQVVYVALSANNLPALAKHLRESHPDAMMLIAADRDDNGTGQLKAEEAAKPAAENRTAAGGG